MANDPITIAGTGDGREPQVAGSGQSVAAIVRVAYDEGLAAAARLLGDGDNAQDHVAAALTYCAERRCDQDTAHSGDPMGARCRACRLWTGDRGLTSFDTLLEHLGQRASQIQFAKGGVTLALRATDPELAPTPILTLPGTLADLARDWEGEEYWFIARRVRRRTKHDKARADKLKPDFAEASPAFILVAPQMADNIGMVARAMANFAAGELRLVAPRDGWPNDKARFAASGAHAVIDAAKAYPDTSSAIADLNWVCATTARPRHLVKPVLSPDQAIAEMIQRMGRGERCGVLFGPERTGLSTDDVANADAMVMVRVNPTFASLNLAQAVLLMGYEWLKQTGGGAIGRHTLTEGVAATGLHPDSPPATKAGLLAFFDHLEEELARAGHFKPPEKRQTMVRNLRSMFERMGATQQEVRTLRGIVASLTRQRHTGGDTP
jgi:tRNA/rRNA methyltransferase